MDNQTIWIIAVLLLATIGIIIFLKTKKSTPANNTEIEEPSSDQITLEDPAIPELVIQVELLPADRIPDENKLVEIKDSKILAHVNHLIPDLMQAGNAAGNVADAIQASGEVLYSAIIPSGAKLADSHGIDGAVRGIYHGANGIRGHADFVAVEAQTGAMAATNTAAAAMSVASMVVGQYYMHQINAELAEISSDISKIAEFQSNEYCGKVMFLANQVKVIADYQAEILENDELRLLKISQLDILSDDCAKLLGQANKTLADCTEKTDLDYTSYETALTEVHTWYIYQKLLLDILSKISALRYVLHLGAVSRGHCNALLQTYTEQSDALQSRLTNWHQMTAERLKIDISSIRRKREGVDGAIHFLPGLFKDDLKYKAIEKNTAKMIIVQTDGGYNEHEYDTSELYNADVQLISKGGKLYYLPIENNELVCVS